jgi:hypothetical protein
MVDAHDELAPDQAVGACHARQASMSCTPCFLVRRAAAWLVGHLMTGTDRARRRGHSHVTVSHASSDTTTSSRRWLPIGCAP